MGKHNAYAAAEVDYLKEKWGYVTLKAISKNLDRSETGLIVKAKRLNLGSPYNEGKYLTANKTAQLLGVDVHTVTDYWIAKCGLGASFKRMRNKKMCLIEFDKLVEWLKCNQSKWDSRRVELYGLSEELDWLKEKRKADKALPSKQFKKWSSYEDSVAIQMFKRGMKIKDIAAELCRSVPGVKHRLSRLDVWGTGKYVGERKR